MSVINLCEGGSREISEPMVVKKNLREVKRWQLWLFFFLPILLVPVSIVASVHGFSFVNIFVGILFIAVSYILLRMLSMGCIYMYKAFAPMKVRNQCRFIPSCSSYTLISLRRYGIIAGVLMGWMRISNCHRPYGGEDAPKFRHILRLFKKNMPPSLAVPDDDENE